MQGQDVQGQDVQGQDVQGQDMQGQGPSNMHLSLFVCFFDVCRAS